MEHQIEKARDVWINKFKNKWDSQIQFIVIEKDAAIAELTKTYNKQIMTFEEERDQQIRDIQLEFLENIKDLKIKNDAKKSYLDTTYSHKLTQFMTDNLNKSNIYDSICSYILQLKSTILQTPHTTMEAPETSHQEYTQEKPQLITFQNITNIQYDESRDRNIDTTWVIIQKRKIQERDGNSTRSDELYIPHTPSQIIPSSAPPSYIPNYDGLPKANIL